MRIAAAVTLCLIFAVPSIADAHGGRYQGPGGRIPPDAREPWDPPPPPSGPLVSRALNGPGGPDAEPEPIEPGPIRAGYADWSFFWARERDAVLDRIVAGRGGELPDEEAHRWVVPRLRALLADANENFDISSAAAIALARMGDADSAPRLIEMAATDDNTLHRVTTETAALALGLLPGRDTEHTQSLNEMIGASWRLGNYRRPFAAYALMLRDAESPTPETIAALQTEVRKKHVRSSVRPAILTALTVLDTDAAMPDLVRVLSDESLHGGSSGATTYERAAAAAALGAVRPRNAAAAIDALRVIVETNDDVQLAREAAFALGRIATSAGGDEALEIIRILDARGEGSTRPGEHAYAIQAFGLIAAHADVGGVSRTEAMKRLRAALSDEAPSLIRATAAVALGLAESNVGAADRSSPARLRELFKTTTGDDQRHERSAYALALGLSRDAESVPALIEVLEDRRADDALRGTCAVALGIIGSSGVDSVLAALRGPCGYNLARDGTLALGLFGGDDATQFLMEYVASGDDGSYIRLGATAWSLGAIRDPNTLPALVDAARDLDEKYADITRAMSVVAIGRICARPGARTLHAIRDALPRRALTPAALELLTLL